MNAKLIKEKAMQVGYSACGIIPAQPFLEYRRALDERVKAFPHSEGYYKHLYNMVDPPKGGKSIIVCILGINRYKIPDSLAPYIGKFYLFDDRIPFSEQYRARVEFETYLKNDKMRILEGEVPVRWAAAKAGVGKFGRNNLTYSKEHGSYLVIHTWTVDVVLEYDMPPKDPPIAEGCSENCLACVKACPTGALCGSLMMDRGRCIPQIAAFNKSLPDDATKEQMGLWIYGCDVCQDVCPLNLRKFTENEEYPLLHQYEEYLQPENILEMDMETYINIINPRFWYLGEEGLWLWKCNALRAIINCGDSNYHSLIKKCLDNDDPRIREIAKWGCDKLELLKVK